VPAETLRYDPFGRRTYVQLQLLLQNINRTTNYLYDHSNVVQEQISGVGTAHVLYGLGMDERYARTNTAGVVSYFLTDAMGSTIALTDSNGVVQTTYVYGPYGATNASGAANDNPYQFIGRELEFGGLYNMRARYLDTGMGRFLSRDSQGLSSTNTFLAMYSYANNNPLSGMDPTGRFVFGGGIGAIAGGGWPVGMNSTGDAVDAGFGPDGTGVSSGGTPAGGGAGQGGASNSTTPGAANSPSAPTGQSGAGVGNNGTPPGEVPCDAGTTAARDVVVGIGASGVGLAVAAATANPGAGFFAGVVADAVFNAALGPCTMGVTANVAPNAVPNAVATPGLAGFVP
jgi:RHS repeat-associated protein